MWAVTGLHTLIPWLAMLAFSFQLTARVTVPDSYLWFLYPMSLFKYFKRVLCCLIQRPKDHDGCVYQLTFPNILVDMVSSDHRVYSNNDSTLDSTSQAIAHDDFKRSRHLVIGLLHRYSRTSFIRLSFICTLDDVQKFLKQVISDCWARDPSFVVYQG